MDGVLYNINRTTLVAWPQGKSAVTMTIPSGVTTIGVCACFDNKLTSLTIPPSVTTIKGAAFISKHYQLTSITVGANVVFTSTRVYDNEGNSNDYDPFDDYFSDAYYGNGKQAGTYTRSDTSSMVWKFGDSDFLFDPASGTINGYAGSGGVVTVPGTINGVTVTKIGDYAFRNNQLTSVTIPNSVTKIGYFAFINNQLTSITIGANVTCDSSFGSGFETAYSNTVKQAGTYMRSNTSSTIWKLIGGSDFLINLSTGTITEYIGSGGDVVIPGAIYGVTVVAIANGSFTTNADDSVTINGVFSDKGLTGITIPNSVTSIGNYAFTSNQLTSVTIPNSVTSIGDLAFADNQLTSVTIPNSVTSIGYFAFGGNQLTSVTIPNSVTRISYWAFIDNQLTSITIGANVILDDEPFENGFETAYTNNGKQAGTYTRSDTNSTTWNFN